MYNKYDFLKAILKFKINLTYKILIFFKNNNVSLNFILNFLNNFIIFLLFYKNLKKNFIYKNFFKFYKYINNINNLKKKYLLKILDKILFLEKQIKNIKNIKYQKYFIENKDNWEVLNHLCIYIIKKIKNKKN